MKTLRSSLLLGIFAFATFSAGTFAYGEVAQRNAQDLPVAAPLRPANVPDGYVVTPFGYFHSSCVQSLAKGERLLPDKRLQHADGSVEENVAVCDYPRYTPAGSLMTADTTKNTKAEVLPEASGWMANASVNTGSASKSYGAIVTTWTVPPQPAANNGQVLFFFPGLEDINNVQSILQPVLQWSQGQWAIASWNCCLSGITTESPLVKVNPGDVIYGSIKSTCPAGTLKCASWNVLSLDMTTGESTMLSNTPSDGQVFNWAFGGVLEPYYVIACDDYPPNGQITFSSITVFDQSLHAIKSPAWTGTSNSTQTPQCNYGVKSTSRSVSVDY